MKTDFRRRNAPMMVAMGSLSWAAMCGNQASATDAAAVSYTLDKGALEDGYGVADLKASGFLVGASFGNASYELDGTLGAWKNHPTGPSNVFTFQVLYQASPYLSIGAFQESQGRAKKFGERNEDLNRLRTYTFRSKVSGLTLVGTVFPNRRVRIRGILNGLWAIQSLENSENEIGQRREERCYGESVFTAVCTLGWIGENRKLNSIRDSQSRFGLGGGVGVEVQWFPHGRLTLDFTRRTLGDDYFDGSLHLESKQNMWQFGFQYGPF